MYIYVIFINFFYIIFFIYYRMDNLCWFLDYEVDVNCLDENFCIVLVSIFYIYLLGFFVLKNLVIGFIEF